MGNQNVCHGAIGNDNIKGFCEVISKMVKEIGDLKTDLNMIKKATMGEKVLSENVKELTVAINKAKSIEAMVSKIMEMEKKVKELEGIRDDKSLETNLKNLVNRVDRMELTGLSIPEWTLPEKGWIKINFDGASRGNPGASGVGVIVRDDRGNMLAIGAKRLVDGTNNVAECQAALEEILMAGKLGVRKLHLEGDSQVVVNGIARGRMEAWFLDK
ncbi:uncharacterized protein LOC131065033 [Cryptomeria japonica]|uniref:uncharacterized protein LOC131065033 n=1 Tax=Cryptomeria japonica TaxID=3369 RepID=UPI0027DA5E0C|nr:uncharacterized protein LOC131065033 [Cryptomeria japonica]